MNINKMLSSTGTVLLPNGTKVLFDNIEDEICAQIEYCDIVVGCSYSLTNINIIEALKKKKDGGVCIILDKKSVIENKRGLEGYNDLNSKLTPYSFSPRNIDNPYFFYPVIINELNNHHSIRLFGLSTVPYRDAIMIGNETKYVKRHPRFHHKFLVFCDKKSNGEVIAKSVLTGSYNFTENANYSRENAILLEDEQVAKSYLCEWEKCVLLSESLEQFNGLDICPEFISESSFKELKNINDKNNSKIDYEADKEDCLYLNKIGAHDDKFSF